MTASAPFVTAVHAGELFADPAYQRDLDPRRVAKMADEFDPRLIGVLEVSMRGNGLFAILDGQHRHAVILLAHPEGKDAPVVCQVYEGLSIEDEARLFHEINARRKALTWWDHWRARRGAGDPAVLAIDAVLERHSLQVNPGQADGNVRATRAIETIVEDLGDLEMLNSVLVVVTSAWGRSVDAFDGALMQGVAHVVNNYDPDELDIDRLVRQLSEVPPRQLRARAASLREIHRGTLPRLCAAVIVERYNAGRGRRVEDFLTRVPELAKGTRLYTANRHQRRHRGGGQPAAATEPELSATEPLRPAEHDSFDEVRAAAAATPPATHRGPHPMVAVCACGHTQRRHEDQAGICTVGDCDCTAYVAGAA